MLVAVKSHREVLGLAKVRGVPGDPANAVLQKTTSDSRPVSNDGFARVVVMNGGARTHLQVTSFILHAGSVRTFVECYSNLWSPAKSHGTVWCSPPVIRSTRRGFFAILTPRVFDGHQVGKPVVMAASGAATFFFLPDVPCDQMALLL